MASQKKSSSVQASNTAVEPEVSVPEATLNSASADNADEIIISEPTAVEPVVEPTTANKKCIKATLTKTNKRDVFGNPRCDNLDIANEGDTVSLEYMDEIKAYLVLNKRGNELGEIGTATSIKILESSDGKIIAAINSISETVDGKYTAIINVYV